MSRKIRGRGDILTDITIATPTTNEQLLISAVMNQEDYFLKLVLNSFILSFYKTKLSKHVIITISSWSV